MTSRTLTFPKIKRDRVFEQVSHEIKKQISKGTLKPGDKLPPESELARNFNVSRQTIREAMRILELSGFITIKRGVKGGAIIENSISNRVSEGLVEAIQMEPATLDDLLLAWREIEKVILVQAIIKADKTDIRSLRGSIEKAEKMLKKRTPVFQEVIEFHKSIAKASKNHIFEIVLNSIMAVYADFLSRLEPELEAAREVISVHERMLNAIVKKKEREALNFLEEHLSLCEERIPNHFFKKP